MPTLGAIAMRSYGYLLFFVGWLGMLLLLLPRHDWEVGHFAVLIGGTLLYRYLLTAAGLTRSTLVALLLLPLAAAVLVDVRESAHADVDDAAAGMVIAAWLLAALLMSYEAVRFVLLLAAPFGIAMGVAAGRLHLWLDRQALASIWHAQRRCRVSSRPRWCWRSPSCRSAPATRPPPLSARYRPRLGRYARGSALDGAARCHRQHVVGLRLLDEVPRRAAGQRRRWHAAHPRAALAGARPARRVGAGSGGAAAHAELRLRRPALSRGRAGGLRQADPLRSQRSSAPTTRSCGWRASIAPRPTDTWPSGPGCGGAGRRAGLDALHTAGLVPRADQPAGRVSRLVADRGGGIRTGWRRHMQRRPRRRLRRLRDRRLGCRASRCRVGSGAVRSADRTATVGRSTRSSTRPPTSAAPASSRRPPAVRNRRRRRMC